MRIEKCMRNFDERSFPFAAVSTLDLAAAVFLDLWLESEDYHRFCFVLPEPRVQFIAI